MSLLRSACDSCVINSLSAATFFSVLNTRKKLLAWEDTEMDVNRHNKQNMATQTKVYYHLAGAASIRVVQHSEEEAKLTGETKLSRTLVVLHGTANWLQEIQNLWFRYHDSIFPRPIS